MIKLTETDGGKIAAGFPNEYNDCAVRALAISTGIKYGDAHDMLRERGRRDRKGTKLSMIESSLSSLSTLGIKFVHYISTGATLAQFIRLNRTGRFLLITNRHALTLIDGIV